MKRRIQTILCLTIVLSGLTEAQPSSTLHNWVFFRNKDAVNIQTVNPASIGISERALKRRAKTLLPDQLIDELDLPVSASAIEQIERTGVKIRSISRWLNAVSVEATPQQLHVLANLSIVTETEKVAIFKRPRPKMYLELPSPSLQKKLNVTGLDYGPSKTQLAKIRIIDLHNIGINGAGVLIGMLDDGFNNYRTHTALKNINVVADSDFIHNISDVSRQPWENIDQGNHGAGTLSSIGGFDNGNLIGAAYGASFILAKTEMDSSGDLDFHSEEDTYVAALEWMERLGTDVTSSSLGYKEFWDSTHTKSDTIYTTLDMNGRTTKVARAAVIAARKGIVVVTAVGNEGNSVASTLISPADADSIIAVGATTSDGILASFSSSGPTSDGRIKPEVVAQGVSVFWADGRSTASYLYSEGTSCSTPLAAGAAALVLSAHPELTNMQVREALLRTAKPGNFRTQRNSFYPNNYYGYGFVDAYSAAQYFGRMNSLREIQSYNYPNPFVFPNSTTISFELPAGSEVDLAVFNLLGQRIKTIFQGWVLSVGSSQWDGTDQQGHYVASGIYFIRIRTNSAINSKKLVYLR